jgi:putative tryptophan/tyrosine transport system substrate-binding protein
MLGIERREFIALVGGGCLLLAVKVKRAWGQQPAMRVIGFLSSASPDLYSDRLRTFRLGLNETGYVEGQNVEIDYRWAEGHNDRLPVLAAELVHRQVAVIAAAGGTPSALAAKAATTTIPTVFGVAVDPVEVGLVASLSRPGGNLTGVTNLNAEVGPKRLELLHELLPNATGFGVLVDPTSPTLADAFSRGLHRAAHKFGVQLHVVHASTESDLDKVFATLVQLQVSGLIIGPGTLFAGRSKQLGALSVRHAMPTVFQYREFAAAGGLMSYGSDETEYYRLVGIYVGKILKGEKPADLPVQQAIKVELIVNLRTANALGVTVPLPLLGRADEVIE